jgi:predicted transcriptional regulator
MAVATVNINEDLLQQMDQLAQFEDLSRSELIYKSITLYVKRKLKLQSLYAYGEQLATRNGFIEDDVMSEIKDYRSGK